MNFSWDLLLQQVTGLFQLGNLKLKLFFKTINKLLKFIALYIAVAGLISFSCFIMEESIQLLSFANFSASDTRSYGLMYDNLQDMKKINNSLHFLNKYFLWMLPPQRMGYGHYVTSTDLYIATLKQEILANRPSLFIGQEISFKFYYEKFHKTKNNLFEIKAGKIKIIQKTMPDNNHIQVTGVPVADPVVSGGIIVNNS